VFDGHIGKVVRNVDRNIMFSIVHSICIIWGTQVYLYDYFSFTF
jgi:hypothetical protein